MYKCIKSFMLPTCDDDGFTLDIDESLIEKDSKWFIPEDKDFRLIGGEIRLENEDGAWLEIDKGTFDKYFEIVYIMGN